ncbi:MAG: arginine--tRNA ligase [Deltaproteobacteria bacterium]|jgi:arginyl-tRNA synthetase|nr:arginine--tRNA ligase [Deltaproteobacteria bacterium]
MKQKIKNMIYNASKDAYDNGDLPSSDFPEIEVEEPNAGSHGDFSTNISMVMASIQKMPPRKIAEAIIKNINDPSGMLDKTEIAGPGFINFFLNKHSWHPVLQKIHERDALYGASDIGKGKKIQVEFVSANPTGPLHVGHGRGAAVGDSVANILLFCGYNVEKEYYINDSGRQINTLGRSVFLRYKELFEADVQFPEDCYQGDYVRDLAGKVRDDNGDKLLSMSEDEAISYCARFAADNILAEIKEDLESFGVVFDRWYSEQGLYDSGKVDRVINDFRKQNIIFEDDGALWFRTEDFGDEKNRVVVRSNGLTTYFASDIAYHQDKFDRGFERIIDVWGADHHGYIPRVSAAIEASGHTRDKFNVILIQLVNLLREGEPVSMSTRSGEFVTLRDVISEVGSDAARFIFLTRHYESALDFDLELAKKKTNDNPVYYVQYVHARISSIVRKARERGISEIVWNDAAISGLNEPEEIQLIKIMARYPEIVRCSAEYMEPHRITYYLMNLASAFHAYYNKHRVLTDEAELTIGRLYLVLAIKKIIRNGLSLLGVSAPEKM